MSDAVVIGAGPAGLTAAHELASRTGLRPIVLESTRRLGGLSCTVEYRGNRIDIGGHRFFSKSDRVMAWWLDRLPLEKRAAGAFRLGYQGRTRDLETDADGPDPHETDRVMLLRERRSRILWRGRLFDYPLSLSPATLQELGPVQALRSGLSYLRSSVRPVADERTLEDFLINRFGRELYRTFFKSYTEKVWGVACDEIPAEWGEQRIKGVSVRAALRHALTRATDVADLAQTDVETSLIERFLYPKYGPGQMWETVADEVRELGGEVRLGWRAVGLERAGARVEAVVAEDPDGRRRRLPAEVVFSSMPVPALVDALGPGVPAAVRDVASALPFRDFFTVGLLVDRLRLEPDGRDELIRDNWIYIQEPEVELGRLQIFNNWSPWLVSDPSKVWLGLEYFCYRTDPVWSRSDRELIDLGAGELARIGVIDRGDVLDGCVLRVPRTYPAYFGAYDRFDVVREWLRGVPNLYCVGRNGQHRYNNQDHSMLTSMLAVDGLVGDGPAPDIWSVNTERDYHEER